METPNQAPSPEPPLKKSLSNPWKFLGILTGALLCGGVILYFDDIQPKTWPSFFGTWFGASMIPWVVGMLFAIPIRGANGLLFGSSACVATALLLLYGANEASGRKTNNRPTTKQIQEMLSGIKASFKTVAIVYPEFQTPGSPFALEFRRIFDSYDENDNFFTNPDYPMEIAKRADLNLRARAIITTPLK